MLVDNAPLVNPADPPTPAADAATGPVLLDIDVHPVSERTVCAQVAAALGSRGTRWQATVPAGSVQGWLPDVVARLRAEVSSAVRAGAPGTVHAFGWRAAVVATAARRPDDATCVVAHLGDGPADTWVSGAAAAAEARLGWAAARSADLVVLDSEWALERAIAHGIPRSALVKEMPVAPDWATATPWRAGAKDQPRTVLAVGGVGRFAGTGLLMAALSVVDDVRLVVAAPRGASEAQLASAGAWLHTLGQGARHRRPEVAAFDEDLLTRCDLVVDASNAPTSVSGVVSAMAHRRAVLTTDVGSRREIVIAGTTGEVVAVGSPQDLRSQVLRLVRNSFKLEAYGEAGLERSRASFSAVRRAELVLRLDHGQAQPLRSSA